jgi:hypothetical protein
MHICAVSMTKSLAPMRWRASLLFCIIVLAHFTQSRLALAQESQPTISVQISAGHARFRVGEDIPSKSGTVDSRTCSFLKILMQLPTMQ